MVIGMAILALAFLSLGCGTEEVPVTTAEAPATTEAVSSTTEATPATTEAVAESNVQDIVADYVYTSELITILYPLYGSKLDDFFIITVENQGSSPAKVIVKSEIPGYTSQAVDTVELAAGEALEVRQNPLLIPDALEELNVQKPAQVHIKVSVLDEGEEKTILEETGETLIYARRDFPLSIEGFSEAEVFDLFAAMVTPNDPAVEELIRRAADYTESGQMWSGYGDHTNDDDGGVWDRLQAIWQAENDYDLAYISTSVSFAPGAVQRIRLPAEVLGQRSGNCIELAMLYAAAAEAIRLESALILIPGHAFVGVRTDQENADYYFVETTMIGGSSFSDAVDVAGEEFDETLPHLDAEEEGYGWVKIWDARESGILPLPW